MYSNTHSSFCGGFIFFIPAATTKQEQQMSSSTPEAKLVSTGLLLHCTV